MIVTLEKKKKDKKVMIITNNDSFFVSVEKKAVVRDIRSFFFFRLRKRVREREQHEWKGGKGERRIMRSSRYGELDSTPLPPKKKEQWRL